MPRPFPQRFQPCSTLDERTCFAIRRTTQGMRPPQRGVYFLETVRPRLTRKSECRATVWLIDR